MALDPQLDLSPQLGLSQKRERFCVAMVSGKSPAEAAREAGYKNGSGLYVTVHRLLRDTKVLARIAELREPAARAAGVTLESHLRRLNDLSGKAEGKDQYGSAIRAEIARGQAAGLYAGVVRFDDLEGLPDDMLEQVAKGKPPRTLRVIKGGAA